MEKKRGIFTSIIIGFIGLAYDGISSFLHNRQIYSTTSSCTLKTL